MNFPGGPGPMPQGMMMQGRPGFAGPPGPGFAHIPFNGPVPNNGFGPRPPGPPAPFAFGAGQQHFYPGAVPQGQQQQRPQMMNVGPQPGPGMGAPMGFGMGPGVMGGAGVTHEVSVPADLIGSIIGKGGAKINEVRQMSASNVKILDPQPGAPAGANRRIVVSGAPQNVQMAVQMLNQVRSSILKPSGMAKTWCSVSSTSVTSKRLLERSSNSPLYSQTVSRARMWR